MAVWETQHSAPGTVHPCRRHGSHLQVVLCKWHSISGATWPVRVHAAMHVSDEPVMAELRLTIGRVGGSSIPVYSSSQTCGVVGPCGGSARKCTCAKLGGCLQVGSTWWERSTVLTWWDGTARHSGSRRSCGRGRRRRSGGGGGTRGARGLSRTASRQFGEYQGCALH